MSLRLNDSLSDDGTYAQRTTPSNGHSIRGMKRIKVEQSKLLTWENILFLFQAIADDLTEKNISYRQVISLLLTCRILIFYLLIGERLFTDCFDDTSTDGASARENHATLSI